MFCLLTVVLGVVCKDVADDVLCVLTVVVSCVDCFVVCCVLSDVVFCVVMMVDGNCILGLG